MAGNLASEMACGAIPGVLVKGKLCSLTMVHIPIHDKDPVSRREGALYKIIQVHLGEMPIPGYPTCATPITLALLFAADL